MAADLLFAVARDADVHGQRAGRGQLGHSLEDHVEVALVVGDAACEELALADRWLEGRALPELERRGRLDVEVPVDEHGRSGTAGRRRHLADRERTTVLLDDVGLAPGLPDERADPIRSPPDI